MDERIRRIKKSLECCRADENGNLEHCGECPYDAVSICVDECRTAMNLDIYAVMDEAGLFDDI